MQVLVAFGGSYILLTQSKPPPSHTPLALPRADGHHKGMGINPCG